MTASPMVSFVIINWNGKPLLEECLPSIEKQDFRDFEILVVDNGSTDGSREFLRERYPEIRVIALDSNQGFAEPNNLAFHQARGEFIATVNNDIVLHPAWLSSLVGSLRKDPKCFAAQGKILLSERPDTVDTCGLGIRACGAARNLAHHQPESRIQNSRAIFTVSAGAALYRKSVLEELHYFDASYFAYYEDLDLGWRAQRNGWHAIFVPEAVAYHKVHGTSAQVPGDFLWLLSERNRLRTLYKNLPVSILVRRPLKLVVDELRYVDMIRKKARWRTLLRARATVLLEILTLRVRRSPGAGNLQKWEEWLRLSQE